MQLLDKDELRSKFEWINNNDLELGSFGRHFFRYITLFLLFRFKKKINEILISGYNNEGWVDSRKYLLAVREKAIYMGADYVEGLFSSS